MKNKNALHVEQLQLLSELLADTDSFEEGECLELSSEREKSYLSGHYLRFMHTVNEINITLSAKNKNVENFKILDIGTTPFTWALKTIFNADVFTIDLSTLLANRCILKDVVFSKCNVLEDEIGFPSNYFDIVVFTEVFEHLIGSPQVVFANIRKVLKDDGVLIMSTPNIATYKKRLNLLFGKSILEPVNTVFREEVDGGWIHGSGHYREFTLEETKELLRNYNFRIIKYEHIIDPFRNSKIRNPFEWLKLKFLRFLTSRISSLKEYNLVLAQKKL